MSQKSDRDNRSNQLNPNNSAYSSSRNNLSSADDDYADDAYTLAHQSIKFYQAPAHRWWNKSYETNFVELDGTTNIELLNVKIWSTTPPSKDESFDVAKNYYLDKRHQLGSKLAYTSLGELGEKPQLEHKFEATWDKKKTERLRLAAQYWHQAEECQKQIKFSFSEAISFFERLHSMRPPACRPPRWRSLIERWLKRFREGYKGIPTTPSISGQIRHCSWHKGIQLFISDIRSAQMELTEAGLSSPSLPSHQRLMELERRRDILIRAANHRCRQWTGSHHDGDIDDPFEEFIRSHKWNLERNIAWHEKGNTATANLRTNISTPTRQVDLEKKKRF